MKGAVKKKGDSGVVMEEKVIVRRKSFLLAGDYFSVLMFLSVSFLFIHGMIDVNNSTTYGWCAFYFILSALFLAVSIFRVIATFEVRIVIDDSTITACYFIKRKPRNLWEKIFYDVYCRRRYGGSIDYCFLTEFTLPLKDIKEYGFLRDMNKNKQPGNREKIVIVSKTNKRYNIPVDLFNISDFFPMVNKIYHITNLKPTGELNYYLNN